MTIEAITTYAGAGHRGSSLPMGTYFDMCLGTCVVYRHVHVARMYMCMGMCVDMCDLDTDASC